jgi:hypothetical protein
MRSYKDTVKDMEEFLDLPQIERALSDAADRGNRLEIIIHSNASETLRKLLKEGKADGYYSPTPTITNEGKSNNFLLYGRASVFEILFSGVAQLFTKMKKYFVQRRSDFTRIRSQCYPIPTDKVDGFFARILAGKDPEEMVKYLMG